MSEENFYADVITPTENENNSEKETKKPENENKDKENDDKEKKVAKKTTTKTDKSQEKEKDEKDKKRTADDIAEDNFDESVFETKKTPKPTEGKDEKETKDKKDEEDGDEGSKRDESSESDEGDGKGDGETPNEKDKQSDEQESSDEENKEVELSDDYDDLDDDSIEVAKAIPDEKKREAFRNYIQSRDKQEQEDIQTISQLGQYYQGHKPLTDKIDSYVDGLGMFNQSSSAEEVDEHISNVLSDSMDVMRGSPSDLMTSVILQLMRRVQFQNKFREKEGQAPLPDTYFVKQLSDMLSGRYGRDENSAKAFSKSILSKAREVLQQENSEANAIRKVKENEIKRSITDERTRLANDEKIGPVWKKLHSDPQKLQDFQEKVKQSISKYGYANPKAFYKEALDNHLMDAGIPKATRDSLFSASNGRKSKSNKNSNSKLDEMRKQKDDKTTNKPGDNDNTKPKNNKGKTAQEIAEQAFDESVFE